MKINTQTIPPELAAAYAKLVSRKPTLSGPAFIARTKAAAHKPMRKKGKSGHIISIEKAVDFLVAYITSVNKKAPPTGFRAQQIYNLRHGIFEPHYWKKCIVSSDVVLENVPTNFDYTGPRNYAYPDPSNLPSIAIYGAGTLATGDASYVGATQTGRFNDLLLKWRRIIFELNNEFIYASEEPIFVVIEGTITASADQRPSRAMLSTITKSWLLTDAHASLHDTEPPVVKARSHIYRYITPRGVSPYFYKVQPIRLIHSIRSKKGDDKTGVMTSAKLLLSPMPMHGYKFNNNTAVQSSITATADMLQVNKCSEENGALYFRNGSQRTVASVAHNSGVPFTKAALDANLYSTEGTYPFLIAYQVVNEIVERGGAGQKPVSGGIPAVIKVEALGGVSSVAYSGNRGPDKAKFTLTADQLAFIAAPDRDAPTDRNLNNIYETCIIGIDATENVGFSPLSIEVLFFYRVTATYSLAWFQSFYMTPYEWSGADANMIALRQQIFDAQVPIRMQELIAGGGTDIGVPYVHYFDGTPDAPWPQTIATNQRVKVWVFATFDGYPHIFELSDVSQLVPSAFSSTLTQVNDADNGWAYQITINGRSRTIAGTIISAEKYWPLS